MNVIDDLYMIDSRTLAEFKYFVKYSPALAACLDSMVASVLFTRLSYWTPLARSSGGWVWKTSKQMQKELAMSRRELENARNVLKLHNILEEELRVLSPGTPKVLHYRLNFGMMDQLYATWAMKNTSLHAFYSNIGSIPDIATGGDVRNGHGVMSETGMGSCPIRTGGDVRNGQDSDVRNGQDSYKEDIEENNKKKNTDVAEKSATDIQAAALLKQDATEIAQYLLECLSRQPRKYVTSLRTSVPPILQMLKTDKIPRNDIMAAIDWLFGPNLTHDFAIEVEGGRALRAKWNKIQNGMARKATPSASTSTGSPAAPDLSGLTKYQQGTLRELDAVYKHITGVSALEKLKPAVLGFDEYFDRHTAEKGKLAKWPQMYPGGVWKLIERFLEYVEKTCVKWERMPPRELFVGSTTWLGYVKHELNRSGVALPAK